MDISKIKPTAKFTRTVNGEEFTLDVEFRGMDMMDGENRTTDKRTEYVRDTVFRAVTGWDLTDGSRPVPCNAENRAKWLPPFLMSVSKENPDVAVMVDLFTFVNDPANFLGN
jgi:hypothetical protein